jgi:hypothetical protein
MTLLGLLQNDDPAARRMAAFTERRENCASVERERGEGRPRSQEGLSVPPRVGHQQEQGLSMAVPGLDRHAPLQRLQVVNNRLRFHVHVPAVPGNHCVPAPSITRAGQRHFRSPVDAGAESGAKALQQPEMPRVAQRIARRKGPGGDGQADDVSQAVDRGEGRSLHEPSFQAADARCLEPAGKGDRSLTQTRAASRKTKVSQDAGDISLRGSPGSIDRPLPGTHRGHHRDAPFAAAYRATSPPTALCVALQPTKAEGDRGFSGVGSSAVRQERRQRDASFVVRSGTSKAARKPARDCGFRA